MFDLFIYSKFYSQRVAVGCFVAFLIFWIAWDTRQDPSRLISLVGLFVYIFIGFLFSKKRDQVRRIDLKLTTFIVLKVKFK